MLDVSWARSRVNAVASLLLSWARSLRAAGKSPNTVSGYLDGLRCFTDFLRDRGLPQSVMLVKREHVEILERELAEHGAGVWTRRRRAREPDALANADAAPGEGASSDEGLVARSGFRRISRTNRSSRGRAPFSLGAATTLSRRDGLLGTRRLQCRPVRAAIDRSL